MRKILDERTKITNKTNECLHGFHVLRSRELSRCTNLLWIDSKSVTRDNEPEIMNLGSKQLTLGELDSQSMIGQLGKNHVKMFDMVFC